MPPQQAYGLLDVIDERRGFGAHGSWSLESKTESPAKGVQAPGFRHPAPMCKE
jgi:hypothetical protein